MTSRQRACGFVDVGEFRDDWSDGAERSDGVTAMQSRSGSQQPSVLMEWGERGAAAICPVADYAVIVDILSFTTALSVAIDAGAEVFPYRWRDESAPEFARSHDAVLAVGRSTARGPGVVSLSPASISSASGVSRIVLPSPNGSALASQLASCDARVLGACLRNRMAIARWLADRARASQYPPVIAVIAAGERWPDNSLRPAVEDLWGAGAVIGALQDLGLTTLSPEARSAAAAFAAVAANLAAELADSTSGRELADIGFGHDVAVAADLEASASVPVLAGDRFVDAGRVPA
jgi:2-phosphosulfolactate phosphatase